MKSALIFLYLCVHAYAWTSTELTESSPDQPGSCVSMNQKIGIMTKGEVRQLENCVKAICGKGQISYYGCGSIGTGPGCHIVDGDLTEPYPKCCPTIKCL